jgi:hypothetical protein
MEFKLEKRHVNVSDKELLDDLVKVAKSLKKDSVYQREYNHKGKFNSVTLCRRFGSWFKALEKAGLKQTKIWGTTDEEYFKNLEEVWVKLGRQPKLNEMKQPLSKYTGDAYRVRFGGWTKALEEFIKYANKKEITYTKKQTSKFSKHKTKRSISWRLKFLVMRRDGFKCKICGKNPATNPKIVLHVDHIIPWSKGGETVEENLQTLCSECNIGKSNLDN